MEGTLMVMPEQLEGTSSEFSSIGTQIKTLTDNMLSKVTSLNSQWQGDASSAYINKFNQLSDDITRINGMIQEHVTDLQEMARRYKNAETLNVEASSGLPADVV